MYTYFIDLFYFFADEKGAKKKNKKRKERDDDECSNISKVCITAAVGNIFLT